VLGTWIGAEEIPDIEFGSLETRLQGDDKEHFITFMKKMLQWKPEDRATCEEIFFDEWFSADLVESGEIVRE